MFPPDLKVTTEVLWRGAIIVAFIDAGFVYLLSRTVKASAFLACKQPLVVTMMLFWLLMWAGMVSFLWNPVYHYVFPEWSRWFIPPVYAVLFGFIAYFFWWLAQRLPGNPVLAFLFLGGLWGSVTHVWAIFRGILDKPPILQGASPIPTVVLPFFEFIFYWCVILGIAFLFHRRLHASRISGKGVDEVVEHRTTFRSPDPTMIDTPRR